MSAAAFTRSAMSLSPSMPSSYGGFPRDALKCLQFSQVLGYPPHTSSSSSELTLAADWSRLWRGVEEPTLQQWARSQARLLEDITVLPPGWFLRGGRSLARQIVVWVQSDFDSGKLDPSESASSTSSDSAATPVPRCYCCFKKLGCRTRGLRSCPLGLCESVYCGLCSDWHACQKKLANGCLSAAIQLSLIHI